jgi:putative transferase (TIGR04331 family)
MDDSTPAPAGRDPPDRFVRDVEDDPAPQPSRYPRSGRDLRRRLYRGYLRRLAGHLNAVHGERHGERYWEILVGPWLEYFIGVCDVRLRQLREPPPEVLNAPGQPDEWVLPRDFLSFVIMIEEEAYRAQLDSDLLGEARPDLAAVRVEGRSLTRWKRLRPLVSRAVAPVQRLWSRVGRVAMVAPYVSKTSIVAIVGASRGRIVPLHLPYDTFYSRLADTGCRIWNEAAEPRGNELESVLDRILLRHLPYIHVEGYADLRRQVRDFDGAFEVVFSAAGWGYDEPFKLLAARAAESGALLVGHQHGGLHGVGEGEAAGREIERVDRFLSWGWDGPAGVVPFVGLKLSQTVRRFSRLAPSTREPSPLFVLSSISSLQPAGMGCPSGTEVADYLDWQIRFLECLDVPAREALRVRYYPAEQLYGWNQRERIEAAGLACRVSNEPTFIRALRNASLVVSDNNFTTMLESYACDVPTVLFFDPALWPLSFRARGIFDEMTRVGLFHTTPYSAAAHVLAIRKDPRGWWDQSEVKAVRSGFIELFARTAPDFERAIADWLMAAVDASPTTIRNSCRVDQEERLVGRNVPRRE